MTLPLIHRQVPLRQGLVADPRATHVRRMRQAIWLYLYLLLAMNPSTGKRLLDPRQVAEAMGLREATIRSWLGHLRKQGYVTAERQGDLVLVKVTRWQEETPSAEPAPEPPDLPTAQPGPLISRDTLASALECDPEDPFLTEVLAREDPGRLREVLDRVERIPQAQIRKSRLALFRFLLNRSKDL